MVSRFTELGSQTIKQLFFQAFFPHTCLGCQRGSTILCSDCSLHIFENPQMISVCPGCSEAVGFFANCSRRNCKSQLDGLISMAAYSQPLLRNLLHEFKYNHIEEAGEILQKIFAHWLEVRRAAFAAVLNHTVVMPTPMHWYRQNLRGFNQSEILAQVFAQKFGLQYNDKFLSRGFKFKRQAEISDISARKLNVKNSITVTNSSSIDTKNANVVLIDDVTTTGATLESAAQVLKAIGFKQVFAVTLLKG